jgi:hypothetical protein
MFATCRVLLVIALGAGMVGTPTARADDKKPEKLKPAAEPGKPLVIQIDASKLPPDVLKQLLLLAEKPKPTGEAGAKPGAKPTPDTVKPGSEPTKPGTKPPAKPGTESVKPGTKPTGKPDAKPGTKPVTKPAGDTGAKAGGKPGVKVIGLADAIAIAEKTTQGTATKAERKSQEGTTEYKVDVRDGKGGNTRLTIDGDGNVIGTEKKEGEGEKGGSKKKG